LRVRTLHASVLRRAEALGEQGIAVPSLPPGDPLDEASVLVAGRGRAYPALTTAIAERMGLIGALSLETATNFLQARDIDGVVIGDGFKKQMVDDFIADLGADPRFRDLPIAVIDAGTAEIDPERLPNLVCVPGDPGRIVACMAPLVRLRAFAGRLRRMAASLDAKGVVDPDTGLRSRQAFMRDVARAGDDAARPGVRPCSAPVQLARAP